MMNPAEKSRGNLVSIPFHGWLQHVAKHKAKLEHFWDHCPTMSNICSHIFHFDVSNDWGHLLLAKIDMYDSVLVAAFGGVTMNLDGSDELHVHPGILYLAQFTNGQLNQWKSFGGGNLLLQKMLKYSTNTLHDFIFSIFFNIFNPFWGSFSVYHWTRPWWYHTS